MTWENFLIGLVAAIAIVSAVASIFLMGRWEVLQEVAVHHVIAIDDARYVCRELK